MGSGEAAPPDAGEDEDAREAAPLINRSSPWVRVRLGRVWVDRAYYWRDMDDLYCSVWLDPCGGMEMSLVAPDVGVREVLEEDDPAKFDKGFAEARAWDELRNAGQLRLDSPWTKMTDGARAYYSRNHTKVTAGGEVEVFSRSSGSWVKGTVVEKGDTRQGIEYFTRHGERMHKVVPIDSVDVQLLQLLRLEPPPEGVNSVRRSGGADFEKMYAQATLMDKKAEEVRAASELRAKSRPSAARLRCNRRCKIGMCAFCVVLAFVGVLAPLVLAAILQL
jgi:hypothetical protein